MSGMSKANQRQNTRRKNAYASYRTGGVREKNKLRKLMRHVVRYGVATDIIVAAESLRREAPKEYGQFSELLKRL